MSWIFHSVCFKMSKEQDMNSLYELYAHLQKLMEYHTKIYETVKELSSTPSQHDEFEPIRNAATAIINTCDEIEKCVRPPACQCCHIG